MGTNYYWNKEPKNRCEMCGRCDEVETLHIGKASSGWCFGLHIIPEKNINDLPDWEAKWAIGGEIVDEYGNKISPDLMVRIIRDRSSVRPRPEDFDYESNHAEPGPNGLLRHRVGQYCLGHGAGTWDLMVGEFS